MMAHLFCDIKQERGDQLQFPKLLRYTPSQSPHTHTLGFHLFILIMEYLQMKPLG